MNHLSERAFKEWLLTEGVAVPIYTGLNGTEIDGDEQLISCYCAQSEHVAGPLYTANVEIILATPPHHSSLLPPVLRISHQHPQICIQSLKIKGSKRSGIIKLLRQEIGIRVVLMQQTKIDLIRPPVLIVGVTGRSD